MGLPVTKRVGILRSVDRPASRKGVTLNTLPQPHFSDTYSEVQYASKNPPIGS